MESKVLRQIILMSKYGLIGVFLQCLFFNMISASNTSAQKSIEEIYLNLKFGDEKVEEVFTEIERNTDFTFSYRKSMVRGKKIEGQWVVNQSLGDVLRRLSKETDLQFKRVGDNIFVRNRLGKSKEEMPQVIEDVINVDVLGKVTDENGVGLPGVSILIKGKSIGTTTDIDGNYKISVDENATLLFSYVGYLSQEISINGRGVIDISLEPNSQQLDEITVTGYTSQSKRFITGAVSSVQVDELEELPATGIDQALQGRVPGVTIGTGNGPGGDVVVRIRGFGTIGNSDPLYIIDGVPTRGNIQNINPNDVESIQVLKDASAASIYGSRAGNGVIIVTTKKGKVDQSTQISFNSYVGSESFTNFPDFVTPQQLADLTFQDLSLNGITTGHSQYGSGATPVLPDFIIPEGASTADLSTYSLENNQITRANKEGTDWFDEIFDKAIIQNYNLSILGGGKSSQYNVSLGYLNRNGSLIETSFDRYNVRINSQFSPKQWLRIGQNLTTAYSERVGINPDGTGLASRWLTAFRANPLIPVFDVEGNYAGSKDGGIGLGAAFTPVSYLKRNKDNKTRAIRVFGNAYLEADFLQGFTAKSSIGIDYQSSNGTSFLAKDPERNGAAASNSLTETSSWVGSFTWTNTLVYTKDLNDQNRISVLAGTEVVKNVARGFSATRAGFFSEDLSFRFLSASGGAQSNVGFTPQENTLSSLFGKVDYSFANKYMVNATIRRDLSSRFTKGNRSAIFPAFGIGWVVSEESFLQSSSFISSLKIRAGWGQTGNQEIDDFGFADQFASSTRFNSYDLNGTNTGILEGFAKTISGNPDRQWETTTSINVGFDALVLNDALTLSFDWYNRKTTDMLVQSPVPATAGSAVAPFINIGGMVNKGVDLGIGYSGTIAGDLNFNVSANFSKYKNEVTEISDNEDAFLLGSDLFNRGHIATRSQKDQPISSFYGFIADGVIQTGADAGNFQYRDLNNDGTIDDDDRTYIGSPHPDFTFGLNLGLEYKRFDLNVFFRGVQGNDIYNFNRWFTDFNNFGNENRSTRVLNAWTPENGSNSLAQYNSTTAGANSRPSSYFVEDGSYIRLQNLQLGYNFGEIRGISSLRVYVQAQNLLTITDYSGLDPEINFTNYTAANRNLEFGVDQGQYPVSRSFLLGLNFKF